MSIPPSIPELKLDVSDSDSDSDDRPLNVDMQNLKLGSTSSESISSSLSVSSSSSNLSPASAHAARPPSATFKVPLPPNKTKVETSRNVFPMLGGPQRAGGSLPGRRKVPLGPGFSPLDWARLTMSGQNLRGVPQLARYTLEDVAQHKKRDDLWMAIQGKVYNVTQYVKFHPGGAGQLMRGAGKDATELFMKVHPWVNIDSLLEKCHVGYLVKDK
ncbi:hypothetical protein SpCBS45565_g02702 [Spizellomyces sp. 'palustris']|nr:hypothetical protein SpCBS45565_g02702 [Spizellomyces sp. 'palustris']